MDFYLKSDKYIFTQLSGNPRKLNCYKAVVIVKVELLMYVNVL